MMKPQLTIFTPTYNRAYTLHLCYESLLQQTCQSFEWLIIDDGSTDGTKALVDSWIAEGKLTIRYHYQENEGMHGAHNAAYERIETPLNVCIDSDDYMADNAVERILTCWNERGGDHVSGIVALDADPEGKIIGSELPDISHSTLFDLYQTHGVTGDKKLVYRTELTKLFPYPLFEGERYVGLTYKYFKLDEMAPLIVLNEVLCHVDYLPDGSSLNMLRQYRKNPKGFAFFRQELMKLPFGTVSYRYRQAIHYVSSSLLSRNWRFLLETPKKGLTVAALPFGMSLYMYIRYQTKEVR